MDSSKTPKYYQDRYQELMKKELQNAYESNAKISIANFPTGSGKSYLTRQLHKILKLRKTDVIIGDETIPFQRVILTYPTREQCQASVRAIQTMKDQDHDQDIHLLYLRSLEDQINTIKDLRNTNRDEYRHLMQDIANAFKACTDTKDSKQQLRDIEDIEDSFQTLFVVIERNKAKKEENQNCVLVIDRQPESSVKDFKNIYQQLYKAMHENEDLITPRIKMYFPDLQFDRSNIVVCTHHKTFNSLLPFRSANIDSKIDRHSKKDDADENDKPVNKSELEIRNILVIDEIEKFIESYNERKMDAAKKGAIDYRKFCEQVVANAESDQIRYYLEKVNQIIHKHKNDKDEDYKELCDMYRRMETAYQKFVDCVTKIAPKYNKYQIFFQFSEEQNNKNGLPPVYTAYNSDCYTTSAPLYCHVHKGEKAATIVIDEKKDGADFSLMTWFNETGKIIRAYFGYLRNVVNCLQWGAYIERKPQDRDQIIESLLVELGYSAGTEERQFAKTAIYPPIQHKHYTRSETTDWYSVGIYRYYIDKINGNVPGFCRMTAVHIGRSAQAFLSDAAEHFHTIYMLSATAALNAISGIDWAYLSEHAKVYATPLETTNKIMNYFYRERELEYKSTQVEVRAIDVPEQEAERMKQNQDYIENKYFETRTLPVLREYMQTAITGVAQYKINSGAKNVPGMCFEAVLSRTYLKDAKDPLPITANSLKVPEGFSIVFLQLGKAGIQVLNRDEVAFEKEGRKVKIAELCDVEVEDDRYIINLASNTIAFLMTAYRSGERSYNTCIREKTDKNVEWSLAGMLVMQVTNLVPSGVDNRLKRNPEIRSKFKIERGLDAFDLGTRQIRMNTIPPLDDLAHGNDCVSPSQLTHADLSRLDTYAQCIAKKSAGEEWHGLSGLDICGKSTLYSPYKMSALAAYEQTFGRFRNEQRPPYVLLAIQASIQEEHNFYAGEIDQPYPYEMHIVLTTLAKQKQIADQKNALEIHNQAFDVPKKSPQKQVEEQVENRIKIEIPTLKKEIDEAQNDSERQNAINRIKTLIENQENYKKTAVDFTCFYSPKKPKKDPKELKKSIKESKKGIKEFCYIQHVQRSDGTDEPIREFSMVSTLRDRDKNVVAGCSTDSKNVYDNNVRLTDIRNDDQAVYLPRDPQKEFGMGEQMMMLYRVNQNEFYRQFPHLGKRTLERIIRQNRFPYPVTFEGWCTAKGEIGERVFYGLWETARKQNRTKFVLIPSSEYPQVYEDFDFLFAIEDKKTDISPQTDRTEGRKIFGAINVKNVDHKYVEEKNPEIRKEKASRMKKLPEIVNPDHLKVVYLNVMPSASATRQYKNTYIADGMESYQVEMFTKNVTGLSVDEIIKETQETITILEDYFDTKKYIDAESVKSGD